MPTLTTCDDRRPFLSAPNAKRYFPAAACEEARRRIVRSIARNEGPALAVGAVGVGKSMLLAVLAEQFASRMAVVTLPGAQLCTRRALLQVILYELGLPYRHMDEGELRLSIVDHLRKGDGGARRLLLLVDEADSLPIRLLEELRALTNIAVKGAPLVSLVLAGSPILEERFADPQLEAFTQRIAARAYLAPMGREQTFQYVRSQVAAAGLKPERLFAADALEAIYAATGGLPRLVNQLGDQAMWLAEETECTPLDATLIQQAWSELQQLPAPWNTEASSTPTSSATAVDLVEFGELDDGEGHEPCGSSAGAASAPHADDDDELPASIPIDAARLGRDPVGYGELAADFAAIEDSADAVDDLHDREEPVVPTGDRAVVTPSAVNPFAEPFGEEEALVDRYFAFESLMLRKAPQVRNRVDPEFALELGRCGARSNLADEPATASSAGSAATLPVAPPASSAAPEPADAAPAALLVVDDDDDISAPVIPGRQFRRLFTQLASTGALA